MTTLDLFALARQMIAIDTRSTSSNLDLVEFLIPLCQLVGLTPSLQRERRDGVDQYNLLASRRPIDRGTLLLASHSDTVPPGDHALWTTTGGNPFALTERDGILYGLGTADVKLDFLCKLLAVESIRHIELPGNVALAATYGEETGRYGATLLVRRLRELGEKTLPGRVLVGEPTRLRPCTSHRGYVEFRTEGWDAAPLDVPALPTWRLVFSGIAAHSSQPQMGASATSACLDALAALSGTPASPRAARDVATDHAKTLRAPHVLSVQGGDVVNRVAARCEAVIACPLLPEARDLVTPEAARTGVTCTVEPVALGNYRWSPGLSQSLLAIHRLTRRLEADLQRSRVPEFEPPYSTVNNGLVELNHGRLSYVVDCRRVPGEHSLASLDQHEVRLRTLEAGVQAAQTSIDLRTQRAMDSAPFRAASDSELVAALHAELEHQGLPVEHEVKNGTTEAPVYREAGMDVVVFGPGDARGNIHCPNEHVALADLRRCVEIYRSVILRMCAS